MKLNIEGCRSYCEERGIATAAEFARVLDLSVTALNLLARGVRIGYEAVKDIYNKLGETTVLRIIDFEEGTPDGFKSKYIRIGKVLY